MSAVCMAPPFVHEVPPSVLACSVHTAEVLPAHTRTTRGRPLQRYATPCTCERPPAATYIGVIFRTIGTTSVLLPASANGE